MSHRDSVGHRARRASRSRRAPPPPRSPRWRTRARKLYATQFHPEVAHTRVRPADHPAASCTTSPASRRRGRWSTSSTRRSTRSARRSATRRVICGLSGGVDSSVVAALLHRAIGDQLTCVFVDHGMLRLDEAERGRARLPRPVPRRPRARRGRGPLPRRCSPASTDPGAQAPHHRRGVLAGLLRGGDHARGREVPRAGHALPGRHRVGQQDGRQDQEPPQPHPVPRGRALRPHRAAARRSSRTRCARSAPSSACPTRSCTASRSRARASPCASSATSRTRSSRSCAAPTRSCARRSARWDDGPRGVAVLRRAARHPLASASWATSAPTGTRSSSARSPRRTR